MEKKKLKDLLVRVKAGEVVLDDVLEELIPKQADEIKKAVQSRIPIMIFDRLNGDEAFVLHRALKNAGAIIAPNCIAEERNKNVCFLSVYINSDNS